MSYSRVYFPALLAVAYLSFFILAPTALGAFTALASLAGIAFARTPVLLILSFLNFSLGIAFDFFLRVQPYFYFYAQKGVTPEYLCLLSGFLYCTFFYLDRRSVEKSLLFVSYGLSFPVVAKRLFWPGIAVVLGVAAFIFRSESNLLQGDFDAYELQKYPFLEYISLILAFVFLSARRRGQRGIFIGYAVGALFVLICLVTSYRMVAILCTLSMLLVAFNNKRINKLPVVSLWLFSYVALTYISYIRLGMDDVDVEMILGYVDGRLDNTFTGVIETALIYTEMERRLGLPVLLSHFLGTIAPVPNALIPDSMLYIVEANRSYYMPGGGALAGFVIYFQYLLLIPFLAYFYYAARNKARNEIAAMMYLIVFCTITRWWLYGPFVLFKFLGVVLLLYGLNRVLVQFEGGSRVRM